MRSLFAIGVAVALVGGTAGRAGEPVAVTIDLAAIGKPIANKFGDLNMWAVDGAWLETAARYPDDYFRKNFPFVERVQLMAATGGNEQRDLFANPKDRSTLTDYEFGKLLRACEQIVAKGLRPMIKTGWVPLKLSADPSISEPFRTNLRPPADYDAYHAYLKALAVALKDRFGLAQMKTWTWGVGVEYENQDWFAAADGKPETTKLAYLKLYDHTVAALEEALGAENVTVGAHSMTVARGLWDERDFIEHCARGTNFRTGKTGTKLDFLALSYYTPVPGFKADTFLAAVDEVRRKAVEVGLAGLRYGVDEGRVLDGWDGRVIYPREVQHPIQAASDAKLFHLMVVHDVDYFSTWCLTTNGLFGGIPAVSANFRNLAFRMAGSRLVDSTVSGKPADPGDDVGALACYDPGQRVLRILAYNLNPDQGAQHREELAFCVEHAMPAPNQKVTVRTWRLDADHGNWWKKWQADAAARNLQADAFQTSRWTLTLPGELAKPADKEFWLSREAEYAKAGEMKCVEEQPPAGADGTLRLRAGLDPHGVILMEVFPVGAAQQVDQKPANHNAVPPGGEGGMAPASRKAPAPLFRDPVHDGAADATLVWNRGEKCWWMLYTNRRADADDEKGVKWVHGTDIGMASTPDGGITWTYRGIARGLEFESGGTRNTFWAPEVVDSGGRYHAFISYVRGVPETWKGSRDIVHYTSANLVDWKFEAIVVPGSIDACVHRLPSGKWRMWFKNEQHKIQGTALDSDDLYTWRPTDSQMPDPDPGKGEGPEVFFWKGFFWMVKDLWRGLGVYRSPDLDQWQPTGVILDRPGRRPGDQRNGQHPGVLVQDADHAYLVYFVHQGTTEPGSRHTWLQIAQLGFDGNTLTCDRDAGFDLDLKPPAPGFAPENVPVVGE